MEPGSNQNSSNLGLERGVRRLNLLSFLFPLQARDREGGGRGGERGREKETARACAGERTSESAHASDLAAVPGVPGS